MFGPLLRIRENECECESFCLRYVERVSLTQLSSPVSLSGKAGDGVCERGRESCMLLTHDLLLRTVWTSIATTNQVSLKSQKDREVSLTFSGGEVGGRKERERERDQKDKNHSSSLGRSRTIACFQVCARLARYLVVACISLRL